jgi:hypothetical protein
MDFLAMLVSCTDCSSQSVADSRITMRLLYMIRKGVASIDSTMLASTGLTHSGATRPWSGAQRQQHEAELAGLRQVQAGAQRHARRGAEGARQRRHEHELGQHRQWWSAAAPGTTGRAPAASRASCRW